MTQAVLIVTRAYPSYGARVNLSLAAVGTTTRVVSIASVNLNILGSYNERSYPYLRRPHPSSKGNRSARSATAGFGTSSSTPR